METDKQQPPDDGQETTTRQSISTVRDKRAKEMPHHPATETAVSAPGKVLLTGGYLVLDRDYSGCVYALDARIHAIVQQLRKDEDGQAMLPDKMGGGKLRQNYGLKGAKNVDGDVGTKASHIRDTPQEHETEDVVIVRSPQFLDAVWEYRVVRVSNGGGIKVVQLNDGPRNPFVETSLNYALTYVNYVAASTSFGSLAVTILADNDYYSETASTTTFGGPGSTFKKYGVRLDQAHKTGLGSSAALVTALVCALVVHRSMHPEDLKENRWRLHYLAQAVHCAAQGKVGSGFDVAAAVFGSCLYRRFSPEVLSELGEVGSPQFETRLFSLVEDLNAGAHWDARCHNVGFQLPRGLELVLCDVDCGSQTPGMVKRVLEWRERNRHEADDIWDELQHQNESLFRELHRLWEENADRPTQEDLNELRDRLRSCRYWIQKMTTYSQVAIEPLVQTLLLDGLGALDGVVGGVVPGAGGYDAVALLVQDEPGVTDRIRSFVENYKSPLPDNFGGEIGQVRLLGVRHGADGVRSEYPLRYTEWI